MKLFTGGVLKHCEILASTKKNLIATFIVDKSNTTEIVQPVKISVKY